MGKLQIRERNEDGQLAPTLTKLDPNQLTDAEKITELEAENIATMLALVEVYELLLMGGGE